MPQRSEEAGLTFTPTKMKTLINPKEQIREAYLDHVFGHTPYTLIIG